MASVGGGLYGTFKVQLKDLVVSNYEPLVANMQPLAEKMIFLYVIIMGYNCLKGNFGEWTKSVFFSIFAVSVVYTLVFQTNGYIYYMYEPLMYAVDGMMRLILDTLTNTSSGDFNSSIDAAFASIFKNVYEVGRAADGYGIWTNVKVGFAILVLLVIFGLAYVVYFGLLIVALVSLHVQFIMGIFIIFLAAFKGTRFIFFAWLKDLMTYALWPVFAAIIMGISLFFFEGSASILKEIDLENGDIYSTHYGLAVLMGAVCLWLLMKTPQFAASITGGAAGGASGLMGGVIGGMASAAALGMAADRGKDEDGKPQSRIGSVANRIGGAAGNAVGAAASAMRGYNKGRKLEGDDK